MGVGGNLDEHYVYIGILFNWPWNNVIRNVKWSLIDHLHFHSNWHFWNMNESTGTDVGADLEFGQSEGNKKLDAKIC